MKKSVAFSVLLFLAPAFIGIAWANDDVIVDPEAAVPFVTMPAVANFPEGITANPANGDIYVSTFEFDTSGTETNTIVRFDANGTLLGQVDAIGNIPLLGLAFNSRDNKVYFASVGNFQFMASMIRRVNANFNGMPAIIEDVAVIPNLAAPPPPGLQRTVGNPDGTEDTITFGLGGAAVPNGLAFNNRGDLFVSDSFQGAVFRIDRAHTCGSCSAELVVQDGLLATAGFPPFGANGLALSPGGNRLFIANTGDDRILRLNLNSGVIDVFAESINGADGIAFDAAGNLWVAANQADQVVALNSDGRVIAELGEFLGIENGAARGLSFPASLVIVGDTIFVTNAALALTTAVGDEPEEDVSTYTVSKIEIPEEL